MAKYNRKIGTGYGLSPNLPDIFPSPIVGQRDPNGADNGYAIGQIWINNALGSAFILSRILNSVADWETLGGTGQFPITPYVVGPAGLAGYQTIQTAIDAANAAGGGAIFIQPGTYTENLTLYDNISIWGTDIESCIIVGVHTPPAAGTVNFQFLRMNSATHILSSVAAGSTNIIMNECIFTITNGYIFNLPNWTGYLDIFSSTSVGTNDGVVNNAGTSIVYLGNASLGAGVGNVMTLTGSNLIINSTDINCPVLLSGATTAEISEGCEINALLTTAGTATLVAEESKLSAISHGSAGTMLISNCTVNTATNPSIAGAGAGVLTLVGVDFVNNSNIAGTLTTAAGISRGGNFVSQYVAGPSPDARYQTVQAAINAANAAGGGDVYVKPGSYAENLTLYTNVNVIGTSFEDVIITGVHTPPAAGSLVFENITLASATNIFFSAGAGTTNITLQTCRTNCTNGFTFNLALWTGTLGAFSVGELSTNNGFLNNTAGATVSAANSDIGFGAGQTLVASGTFIAQDCSFHCPVNFVTGAVFSIDTSTFDRVTTFLNNSTGYIATCHIDTGAATAVTMSSAADVWIKNTSIMTSNATAIGGAGAGVLRLTGDDFIDSFTLAGTLTLAAGVSRGGNYVSQYVVGAAPDAHYQTVQAAINAANAAGGGTVYIKPGTYTENLTLYSGVSLWGGDIDTTIIVGVHTPPAAGNISMQFLRLNSATHILSSVAAGTTNIIINECIINVTNGYIYNLPGWTGYLDLFSCTSVGTNDGVVNNAGASYIFIANSSLGVGVGNVMTTTGVNLIINSSDINCPMLINGATTAEISEGCEINALLTTAGTATVVAENSTLAAISHGSAGTMRIADCVITTATNPSIDGVGAGVINLNGVAFTNNAAIAAALTVTKATAFDVPLLRATSLQAQGDTGAIASTVTFTNVVDEALGAGAGTVLMKTGNPGNSSGWLKIYNGVGVRYIPYWTNISP